MSDVEEQFEEVEIETTQEDEAADDSDSSVEEDSDVEQPPPKKVKKGKEGSSTVDILNFFLLLLRMYRLAEPSKLVWKTPQQFRASLTRVRKELLKKEEDPNVFQLIRESGSQLKMGILQVMDQDGLGKQKSWTSLLEHLKTNSLSTMCWNTETIQQELHRLAHMKLDKPNLEVPCYITKDISQSFTKILEPLKLLTTNPTSTSFSSSTTRKRVSNTGTQSTIVDMITTRADTEQLIKDCLGGFGIANVPFTMEQMAPIPPVLQSMYYNTDGIQTSYSAEVYKVSLSKIIIVIFINWDFREIFRILPSF